MEVGSSASNASHLALCFQGAFVSLCSVSSVMSSKGVSKGEEINLLGPNSRMITYLLLLLLLLRIFLQDNHSVKDKI